MFDDVAFVVICFRINAVRLQHLSINLLYEEMSRCCTLSRRPERERFILYNIFKISIIAFFLHCTLTQKVVLHFCIAWKQYYAYPTIFTILQT